MIQDIEPHHLFNQFVPDAVPAPGDALMHFEHDALLVRPIPEAPTLPRVADAAPGCDLVRLFNIDDEVFWGCRSDECALVAGATGFEHVPLRRLRSDLHAPRTLYFAANTAYQLLRWYRHNRFCGRCGHPTEIAPDERALDCPGCGRRIYPKIQPAVIVGVTDGADRLIMTKYADRPITHYALVAGFTEIGETLEETVQREVMEEVGLAVGNIRYYKSQPWGIASDILAGFYCDVVGSCEIRRDPRELKEARWFRREEIMGQGDDMSLTNEMMLTFRDGKEPR
jgi:NAD+ diphosphatase